MKCEPHAARGAKEAPKQPTATERASEIYRLAREQKYITEGLFDLLIRKIDGASPQNIKDAADINEPTNLQGLLVWTITELRELGELQSKIRGYIEENL